MQVSKSLFLVVMLVLSVTAMKPKMNKIKKKQKMSRWAYVTEMHKNLTALWSQVQTLSNPVQITVHGMDDYNVDSQKRPDHDNSQENMKQTGTQIHLHFNLPSDRKSSSPHGQENDTKGGNTMAKSDEYTYAICNMKAMVTRMRSKVEGYVALRQKPSEPLEIRVDLKGFYVPEIQRFRSSDRVSIHGLHVHQYADFENGCLSFGGHFNPEGTTHGGLGDTIRHAGDWGNVVVNRFGNIRVNMSDTRATLFGPDSIIGRGIVIHEKADDLGKGGTKASLATGDAGGRLNCCVIGMTKKGGHW